MTSFPKVSIARLRSALTASETKRNTVFALGAEVAQLFLSLAAFFLLARVLGAIDFGLYNTALAHGLLAATIGYFGSQQLLMRDFALNRPFQVLWSRLLSTVVAGTVIFTLGLLLVRSWLLDQVSPVTYAILVVTQMLLFGLTDFAVLAAQAHKKLQVAMRVRISTGFIRLIGVIAFVVLGNGSLDQWAWFGLVAWGFAAVVSLVTVRTSFGARPTLGAVSPADIRDGLPYTLMGGAGTMLDSLDKTMLPYYGYESDNGVYAAGYRVAALAIVPVMALVRATDQDFFHAGARSLQEAYELAKRLVRPVIGFGLLAGVGLYVFAPVFPWILRNEFDEMTNVIRWLAVLPLIRGVTIFAANALTGAGRQSLRNAALIGAMLVNFGVNVWLIPSYGWRGAVGATLIAEALMAAAMWLALVYLAGKDRSTSAAADLSSSSSAPSGPR
jgi:O-antigen/teichoic acid export membrane protein